MSKNNLFTRTTTSSSDGASDGVAELLRQVSERNKEVDEMAKRAQEHNDDDDDDSNKAKPSPIDMIKKKISEIKVSNISINTGSTKKPTNSDDDGDEDNNDSSSATPKTNEWGKEILQKISSVKESIKIQNQLLSSSFQKSTTTSTSTKGDDEEEQDRRPEFLKRFSEQSSKSGRDMLLWGTTSTKGEGGDDDQPRQRPEFLKNLEQSSKSGRDILFNLKKKISIQNPLSSMGVETTASIAERTAQSQYNTEEEIIFPPTIVALPPPETETTVTSPLSETKKENEFTIGDDDEEEENGML
jgi:hypothetical protein